MPFYGTLEAMLEYAPPVVAGALSDSDDQAGEPDALESLLTSKVHCLADILADIKGDIAGRVKLSERVVAGIYQHYLYLKAKLMELYVWPLSGNRAIEQRRSGLEKQLDALNQEARDERVQCWQDVAKLKEEARRWFKQYADLAERVKMVVQAPPGKLALGEHR